MSAPGATGVAILDDDHDAAWYVRPLGGGQFGPANGATLHNWINEGRVASNALVWRDGWPQWREASIVFSEIADRLPEAKPINPVAVDSGADPLDSAPIDSDPSKDSATVTNDQSLQRGQGGQGVGSNRRRNGQRNMTIGVLLGVCLLLVVALVYLVLQGS